MPIWEWALNIVAAVVVVAGLLLLSLVLRRRWLTKGEATFDMSVRLGSPDGARGWTLGVGRYRGDRLEWFRVFSLTLRPKRTFDRYRFHVVDSRPPTEAESYALFTGHLVVQAESAQGPIALALDREALTALLSWLEAGPPPERPP